ncbi:P63C domain-containing protein [candidate division WOR-3 bacterium]|nr:P63C domain-containing protein [candidate division WOR-3 bacterium]
MKEKIAKATHEGILKIGGTTIKCAVLEDGTRVLSRIDALRAIGRKGKAKGGRFYDKEFKLPVFLTAQNLKPFITQDLKRNSTPILFKRVRGGTSIGYKANIFPEICGVFIDAKDAGAILQTQEHIVQQCKILLRGFATVGIYALVDEATGYQEIRDRLALQSILDKFLKKEFAVWAKRFPYEFYKQMFRLHGWQWRGMTVNRPSVVGKFTRDLVYERLAPGIINELEKRNPTDTRGRRKVRHHQWLTEDIGHPALAQHLHTVIALMRASTTWVNFHRLLERALPKKGDTLQLPLDTKD